ncbi:TetR/AcrR family transcriptional regulator [Actinomadura rupiterrae]|uniref:TetR/AcrR family transcriptional regulator n=1 Tax=Actinomadura rupiterrae TaxID=559627 RepID=UPI0020A4455A|nr:TetR/AcrR family transcriptional regulator [Actinomadura rupiterrae]MCP2334896.1 AcrR family transcriptional regulator [Actinomadura rupiterrae]
MPRHKGDHDARRRDVSAAVWRVLAEHGFGGLTLRAVAAEMGATTGLVTHYFGSKQELVEHALALLEERREARPRPEAPEGLSGLRALIADVLPLTPQAAASNRIWVSSWDAALGAKELAAGHGVRYARARERIRHHVQAAQRLGEIPESDPDDVAASINSFVLGLIVQALFDAEAFPPERQLHLLDAFLKTLTS